MEDIGWKIIDKMFKENPNFLIKHHIDSYNNFFSKGIINIFKSSNPFKYCAELDPKLGYKYNTEIFLGGKNGDQIYYGKPIIIDKNSDGSEREHYMIPNEARLRNMTYAFTIHYDVIIEYTLYIKELDARGNETGKIIKKTPDMEGMTIKYEKIYLGKFPIMLQSDFCILNKLTPEVRYNMGECRNDNGGYFIIDGKEKCIMSQEGRADNMLYIKDDFSEEYICSAEIRSVSEDASKPVRTLAVRIVRDQPSISNHQIKVNVPNVRKPVPLFIVMRALGIISDYDIIEHCLLDMNKYEDYIDLFRPSVHDAGFIFTQKAALEYIKTLTKGRTVEHVLDILMNYFLPHMGELNLKAKALYLGYMTKRLLLVYTKTEKETDRDSYRYKRIEQPGMLLYGLFREWFKKQLDAIHLAIDKKYYWNNNETNYSNENFKDLIGLNKNEFFSIRLVEQGFKKAFKGNWGADSHTKKLGVVQDLTRLSFFYSLCQLRKTNLPIAADGAKIVAPRRLNATQYGYLCPIHSPDGGNVGLHKHLSISTHITSGCSIVPYINYLKKLKIKFLEECSIKYISKCSKIFINGTWIGVTTSPIELTKIIRLHRRNNLINIYTSVFFDIKRNEVQICTDAGRPTRPLVYMYGDELSIEREQILNRFERNDINWEQIVYGFGNKKNYLEDSCDIKFTNQEISKLITNSSVIEYIDTQEGEGMLLANSQLVREQYGEKRVTHAEIHPSLILSVMANQCIYAPNNPYPRNAFSCGQGKQAVSLFHSNFTNRIDKTSLVLNYGQVPLTKSRYFTYATKNQHPYGENAIVAIMCYSGYNVEDAVIINEGALKRGLFRTTYYNSYEAHEEKENIGGAQETKIFINPMDSKVSNLKEGYDYSKLNEETGIIIENSIVDEKTIVMGMAVMNEDDELTDSSIKPKKGQTGIVDKSYISKNMEGKRIAKVRIRAERIPAIGDKFCSRAGQKGTVGIILKEKDMPTTAEGIRPDIIVNPHAMPSRMTIGHLVETLTSKASCIFGNFTDCTAFVNKGPKHKILGQLLTKQKYHSDGTEILYNGMTGEQLEADIYIGPTYYNRLKHMPKDKINYRARGPRTALTRQTVQGRANNGGLRIGEMDRDCLIAHGLSHFISESMMVRGDEYKMAVCNKTGYIAIFNQRNNVYLSPMIDGPIKFNNMTQFEANLVNISKFGRDFSIVNVPYAFKLLLQELQTMNCSMRIITEENVDKIYNMMSGSEISKLTHNQINNVTELNDAIIQNLSQYSEDAPKVLERTPVEFTPPKQQMQPLQLWSNEGEFDQVDSIINSGYMPGQLNEINEFGKFKKGVKVRPKFLEKETLEDKHIIYTVDKIIQDPNMIGKLTILVTYQDKMGIEMRKQYDINELVVLSEEMKTFKNYTFKVGDLVNELVTDIREDFEELEEGELVETMRGQGVFRISKLEKKKLLVKGTHGSELAKYNTSTWATLEKSTRLIDGRIEWDFYRVVTIDKLVLHEEIDPQKIQGQVNLDTQNPFVQMEDSPFSPKSPEGVADERDLITVGSTVIYRGKFDDKYIVKDANYNTGKVFIEPKDVKEGVPSDPPDWVPIKELQWLLDEDGNTPNTSETSPKYIPHASTPPEKDFKHTERDMPDDEDEEDIEPKVTTKTLSMVDDDDITLLKTDTKGEEEGEEDKKEQNGGTHKITINTEAFK
jgi:DNA-directed RNA polymerase II subunit RPB2